MSLLERMRANRCAVQGCENERVDDAALCSEDLTRDWKHLLDRQPDGTFIRRRELGGRDLTDQVRSAA